MPVLPRLNRRPVGPMTRSVLPSNPLTQTPGPSTPLMGTAPMAGAGQNPWDPQNVGHTGRQYLQQAGQAGLFDPTGQGVRRLMRRGAMRRSDAMRRRSSIASQLHGLDPMQARGRMVDADISANQSLSDSMSDADLQGIMQQMQFYQGLLGGQVGNADAAARERSQRAGGGGFFGQLAGAALGAVPFGSMFGGGRRVSNDPDDDYFMGPR